MKVTIGIIVFPHELISSMAMTPIPIWKDGCSQETLITKSELPFSLCSYIILYYKFKSILLQLSISDGLFFILKRMLEVWTIILLHVFITIC